MKYLKYLNYVIKHKWYVFLECCKEGIIWQGITHDLSKLLPSEFFPYAEYFNGKGNNQEEFDYAWLLHQKRNRHHWQWWVLPEDDGGKKILNMPLKYRKEMLCDWRGAGRAIMGKDNTEKWYLANKNRMQLHRETRLWVELKLGFERGTFCDNTKL